MEHEHREHKRQRGRLLRTRSLVSGGVALVWAATVLSAGGGAVGIAAASPRAMHARATDGCAIPELSAQRDPANPLALPNPPTGQDPLQGAHFFVDGPRHGQAAGAIAQTLGLDPTRFSDDESWAQFKQDYGSRFGTSARALSKIADQQETQNISMYAQGGGPGAIFAQTQKILCHNAGADPNRATVPVLSTFLIYPNGQFCPTASQIRGWQSTFRRDVDEMASAIGRRRAVILEEIDSIGASSCLRGSALTLWLQDLAYESHRFSQLPHAVSYMEAGYSDAQGPSQTAGRLWRAGVGQVQGFFTNDTHFVWSGDEIRWAQKVADKLYRLSHHGFRAHFVVNTAQNGQGPKSNPNPARQGNEDLCNPPGRGLGRIPTGTVNPSFDGHSFTYLDGFLWTGVPGRSHNSNCPGGPWQPAGVFDRRFALELARNANQQLGPGTPSQPY